MLLDVNLPGESGFDVCQKLCAVSDVPVIFLTSRTDSMDEHSGISGESEYVGVQGIAFCHDKQAGGTFSF